MCYTFKELCTSGLATSSNSGPQRPVVAETSLFLSLVRTKRKNDKSTSKGSYLEQTSMDQDVGSKYNGEYDQYNIIFN